MNLILSCAVLILQSSISNAQLGLDCSNDPCEQSASCVNDDSGYLCFCPVPYQGQNCESRSNGNPSCSMNYYNYSTGNITSPSYPDNYGIQLECNYFLKIPTAKEIMLVILDFVTEPNQDTLVFGEGPAVNFRGPTVTTLSGNLTGLPLIDRTYIFSSNQIFLNFVSDKGIQYKGFQISFVADIDSCLSNPCPDDRICIDENYNYSCRCLPGFEGSACEIDVMECASDPCQNGGTCMDGINFYSCICIPGYTGINCEINIDECSQNPCGNGGLCSDGINSYSCTYCSPAYMGTNCEINVDDCANFPCQNGGTCTDGTSFFTCECGAGFTGIRCETNINECSSDPCLNGGTCTDGIDLFTCTCTTGYTGIMCEIDIDKCSPDPCLSGGVCTDGINSYACTYCSLGYTGTNCDINIDDCPQNPCDNGGRCIDGISFYTCECMPGFTGRRCETNIDECASNPCGIGGRCIDGVNSFACTCIPGFTGIDCEIDINECASDPCLNGGICLDWVNLYICECIPGYTGVDCETDFAECDSNPCVNGVECMDGIGFFTCMCIPGYTGTFCETDINECASMPCRNGTRCIDDINSFTCRCEVGFTGLNCEMTINQCVSSLCLNGGTCLDGINQYTCACVPGFEGRNCQIDIDECASSPCLNGGTCSDRVNVYTCACNLRYTGANCEIARTCSNITIETEFGQARLPITEVGIVIDSEETCPYQDPEGNEAPIVRAVCQVKDNSTTYWNTSITCENYITQQLQQILEAGISDANVLDVAEEVSNITQRYDGFNATDIGLLNDILQLVDNTTSDENVTTLIVEIVNNVMFVDEEVLASAQETDNSTTLIVQVLESQLNSVDVGNGTLDESYQNIAVQVLDLPLDAAMDGIVVTMFNMDTNDLRNSNITVGTHGDTPIDAIQTDTYARVVVPIEVAQLLNPPLVTESQLICYDPSDMVPTIVPSAAPRKAASESTLQSLRVAFAVYANDRMFPSQRLARLNRETEEFNREVNTPVVSFSVGGQKMTNLTERINITFSRLLELDYRDPTCNFWEFDFGQWSMDGCQLLVDNAVGINNSRDEYYTCACDHLTNFAVLVDIYAEDGPPKPSLRILSIIGCSISVVSLVIAIGSYLSIKRVRESQTHRIFICLCTTLLCLYSISLVIIALDTKYLYAEVEWIPCAILAALVHYFVLSSITWMGIEGFNTYLVIIKVFDTYIRRFMIKAAIVGWGIPAVIVAVTGGIAREFYAVEDYCYIKRWPLIGGLLVPVAIILAINIVVFIMAMCRVEHSVRLASRVKKDYKTARRETRERIQNGISTLILLGFTWTTGYLTLINVDLADVLFIISNSLQGFFIFILYCLRKETIRKQWARCIRCALSREDGSTTSAGRRPIVTSGARSSQPISESSSTMPNPNPNYEHGE